MQNTAITELKQKAVENRTKSKSIEELIQKSINELGKALPSHLSAERLVRIALTTIRLNPALADCTKESFLGALFQAAQLGLEPNIEGQAYLIPYTNSKRVGDSWTKVKEVQFQIGYKGYIELFYRHGNAISIDMQTIYENDIFECEYGSNAKLRHVPALSNKGDVIGYYAIAKLKSGGTTFKVMSKDECIEHGRTHSKCYDAKSGQFDKNSPWYKDLDAMCKKTVLIQLVKLLPKSVELQKALAMDATTKSTIKSDMFNVRDEQEWGDVEEPPTTTSGA